MITANILLVILGVGIIAQHEHKTIKVGEPLPNFGTNYTDGKGIEYNTQENIPPSIHTRVYGDPTTTEYLATSPVDKSTLGPGENIIAPLYVEAHKQDNNKYKITEHDDGCA